MSLPSYLHPWESERIHTDTLVLKNKNKTLRPAYFLFVCSKEQLFFWERFTVVGKVWSYMIVKFQWVGFETIIDLGTIELFQLCNTLFHVGRNELLVLRLEEIRLKLLVFMFCGIMIRDSCRCSRKLSMWRADFQSGFRVLKKVFWTFSYLYLWHTMWFHAKKLLKTLKF